jgi:hypothetical protein
MPAPPTDLLASIRNAGGIGALKKVCGDRAGFSLVSFRTCKDRRLVRCQAAWACVFPHSPRPSGRRARAAAGEPPRWLGRRQGRPARIHPRRGRHRWSQESRPQGGVLE